MKLTLPSAFDDAGILMLDSIREVFDMAEMIIESPRSKRKNTVSFQYEQHSSHHELIRTITEGKCPVVQCSPRLYKNLNDESSTIEHVMVATGMKKSTEGKNLIQLKNSHQKDPSEQGIILKVKIIPA